MEELGWGVIGLGRIVNETMAPGMVENPECRLVAGVSRDLARAEAFAERFGAAHAYQDYDEMLANPDVDAVLVATPNALHAEQVIAAARAGKHVLCDKPMGITVDDAVREVQACAEAGVRLGVNFHNRRLAWVQEVRRLVGTGALGEILTVQVEASAGHRPPKDWRRDPELAGLGTTFNIGVHALDFVRYFLGADPIEVMAMFDDEGGSSPVEVEALVLMRFGNGARVYVDANQNNPHPRNDITVYGTEGRIVGTGLTRSRSDGELTVLTGGRETTRPYPQPSGEAHQQNLAAFTRSVLRGEEPDPSGIDGLHSTVLCDAIERSVRERRVVDVDYGPLHRVTGGPPAQLLA